MFFDEQKGDDSLKSIGRLFIHQKTCLWNVWQVGPPKRTKVKKE